MLQFSRRFTFLLLAICHFASVNGFIDRHVPSSSYTKSTVISQNMAPRFDPISQQWTASSEEESAAAGYPPIRSLLRHGPKAFLIRVTQPEQYDQAVLKFMANERCDRYTAQGNMDRYFENAQDWAFERYEMQNKGKVYDYVTIDTKQVVLSSVWGGVVLWFVNDFAQKYVFH